MFYKVGFYFLLLVTILGTVLFIKVNPMQNQGAMSWVEMYSEDPDATLDFLDKNFAIKVDEVNQTATGKNYNIIKASGQIWPFAGVMRVPQMPDGKTATAQTVMYLTVKNYADMHEKIVAAGATVLVNNMVVDGMRFGIYVIPGNVTIGIAQYGSMKK